MIESSQLLPNTNIPSNTLRISHSYPLETEAEVSKVKTDTNLMKNKKEKLSIEKTESSGRWTEEEHQKFLTAHKLYGKNWKLIEEHIGTRTATQARSHAQKYFRRMNRHKNEIILKTQDISSLSSPSISPNNDKEVNKGNLNSTKISKKYKRPLNYEENEPEQPANKLKINESPNHDSIHTDMHIEDDLRIKEGINCVTVSDTIPNLPIFFDSKSDSNTCSPWDRELDIENFRMRMANNSESSTSDKIQETNEDEGSYDECLTLNLVRRTYMFSSLFE